MEKQVLKIGCRSSRSIEYAFSCCCFVKNGKEVNSVIITHAYTATVLVAFAVVVCLLNSRKRNERQEMNIQSKAQLNKKKAKR